MMAAEVAPKNSRFGDINPTLSFQVKGDENNDMVAMSTHATPRGPSKAERAAMEEANRKKKVQIAKVRRHAS